MCCYLWLLYSTNNREEKRVRLRIAQGRTRSPRNGENNLHKSLPPPPTPNPLFRQRKFPPLEKRTHAVRCVGYRFYAAANSTRRALGRVVFLSRRARKIVASVFSRQILTTTHYQYREMIRQALNANAQSSHTVLYLCRLQYRFPYVHGGNASDKYVC